MKSEEFEEILEKNKVVIVDFYADWCQPCKLITPSLEKACERTDTKLLKVDIDNKESVPLAASFNVRSIPFVVRFEDKKVTNTMVGFMGEKYVENFVKGETGENDKQ